MAFSYNVGISVCAVIYTIVFVPYIVSTPISWEGMYLPIIALVGLLLPIAHSTLMRWMREKAELILVLVFTFLGPILWISASPIGLTACPDLPEGEACIAVVWVFLQWAAMHVMLAGFPSVLIAGLSRARGTQHLERRFLSMFSMNIRLYELLISTAAMMMIFIYFYGHFRSFPGV